MKKVNEIPLSGISTSPSDYEVKDGALSMAANTLFLDNAAVSSSYACPSVVLVGHSVTDDSTMYAENALYQHTNGYCHIIFSYINRTDGSTQYAWAVKPSEPTYFSDAVCGTFEELSGKTVTNIESIGNTVIFYTSSSKHFFIFRGESYESIGTNVPEIKIKPFIRTKLTNFVDPDKQELFDTTLDFDHIIGATGDNKTNLANAIIGKTNQMLEENAKNGKFVMPFLVRIAYRLFDGSLTAHTSPVLMLTTEGALPHISLIKQTNNDMFFKIFYNETTLRYILDNADEFKKSLDPWRDIVTGIVFTVSSPIYTYDQSASEVEITSYDSTGKLKNDHQISSPYYEQWVTYKETDGESGVEEKRTLAEKMYMTPARRNIEYSQIGGILNVNMPQVEKSISTRVSEASNFYVVSEMKINDLKSEEDVPIEGDLTNIYSKESISDDFESHDVVIPKVTTTYNNRLIIADVTKTYYDDCYLWDFIHLQLPYENPSYELKPPYPEGTYDWEKESEFIETRESRTPIDFAMAVSIKDSFSSTGSIVRLSIPDPIPSDFSIPYFFYPNPYARKLYVKRNDTYSVYAMEEHSMLNGSVFVDIKCNSIPLRTFKATDTDLTEEEKKVISVIAGEKKINTESFPRLVYTSDVGNPFVFRPANVEQIGTGTILSLVPAAQALSTGQFGDYPMYAFTTDGVWAMYVSETGGWRSKQPISRDVAIGSDSILQLDRSVIFATARGLMHINGSDIQCISYNFDGGVDSFCDTMRLHLNNIMSEYTDISYPIDTSISCNTFKEYLKGANMHYDYTNQRIVISNSKFSDSYVYNMRDSSWSSIALKLTSSINSYPDTLAMAQCGRTDNGTVPVLIDLSANSDIQDIFPGLSSIIPSDSFILTRPIKLDEPDSLKTICTVIARGQFDTNSFVNRRKSPVSLILYGSRDLSRWFAIASSQGHRLVSRHGTPYRYFRVAIITRFTEQESLSRLTVEYETKLQNKLR